MDAYDRDPDVPKRLRRSAVDDAGEEVPPEANPGWNGGGVARSTSLTATCAALARRTPSVQLPLSSTIAPRTTHTISDSPVARRPPRSGMYPMTLCGYDGCGKHYGTVPTALGTTIPSALGRLDAVAAVYFVCTGKGGSNSDRKARGKHALLLGNNIGFSR